MLARQLDVLTVGGGQSPGGDTGGVSHLPAAQPLGEAGLAEPAQPFRAGVLGEQDQRAFVGGVVELLFQGGKDAGHDVAQSVDHPDPVSDQVAAMRGQQSQFTGQIGHRIDHRQVAAQTQRFGDHVGILRIRLALAGVSGAHRVHHPPGGVEHPGFCSSQQGQDQRRRRADDVDRPHHLLSQIGHRRQRGHDVSFDVGHLHRHQCPAVGVDSTDPMVGFADVYPSPSGRSSRHAHLQSLRANLFERTLRTPR